MISSKKQTPFEKYSLIGLIVIGFGLRLFQLDRQSLWFDDIITVHLARLPIIDGLDGLIGQGIQLTPLFHWLVKAWFIIGDSDAVLRLLPISISLLTIPLIYQLGRVYGNRQVGLLCAALFALNPYQIWYAHELRLYSLLTFSAVGAMFTFRQLLKGRGGWNTIGFILFNALGFASHYFMFLLPTVQFIFFLRYFRRYFVHFRQWMLINVLSGAVLLPWFGYIFYRGQFTFGIGWIPTPQPIDLLYTIWNFTLGYQDEAPLWLCVSFLIVLGLLSWGIIVVRQQKPFHFLLLTWLFLPLLIVWLFSQGASSFYVDRYFLIVTPVVTLLLALGLNVIQPRTIRLTLVSLALLTTLSGTSQLLFKQSHFTRDDWRGLALAFRQEIQPTDGLVTCTDGYRLALNYYDPGPILARQRQAGEVYFVYPASADFNEIASHYQRLWVAAVNPRQPQHHLGFSYPLQPNRAKLSEATQQWLAQNRPQVVAVAGLTAFAYDVTSPPDMNELVPWICKTSDE